MLELLVPSLWFPRADILIMDYAPQVTHRTEIKWPDRLCRGQDTEQPSQRCAKQVLGGGETNSQGNNREGCSGCKKPLRRSFRAHYFMLNRASWAVEEPGAGFIPPAGAARWIAHPTSPICLHPAWRGTWRFGTCSPAAPTCFCLWLSSASKSSHPWGLPARGLLPA